MHLLGFSDEHTRPDRDRYLTVDWPHTQVFRMRINSLIIFHIKVRGGGLLLEEFMEFGGPKKDNNMQQKRGQPENSKF